MAGLITYGSLMNRPPEMADLGTPGQVAEYLRSSVNTLAQLRYMGRGPKFIKVGRKVLYRWSDVADWLDRNTMQRTDDPRG
jgi:Helix-turn-helix domain